MEHSKWVCFILLVLVTTTLTSSAMGAKFSTADQDTNITVGNDVSAQQKENECPHGFEQYGDYCFIFDFISTRQIEAIFQCGILGATLPYPSGTDLATWQKNMMDALPQGQESWAGVTQVQQQQQGEGEDHWVWFDGTPVPSEAWLPGEPGGISGPCAYVTYSTGLMGDCPCTGPWPVLCQVALKSLTTETPKSTTEIPKSTTESPQSTTTEAPTTTIVPAAMCYSCIGCPIVNSNTNVVPRYPDQSCFTAFHGDNIIRGVVPEKYLDGECKTVGDDMYCYCNTNLCNNYLLPKSTED